MFEFHIGMFFSLKIPKNVSSKYSHFKCYILRFECTFLRPEVWEEYIYIYIDIVKVNFIVNLSVCVYRQRDRKIPFPTIPNTKSNIYKNMYKNMYIPIYTQSKDTFIHMHTLRPK